VAGHVASGDLSTSRKDIEFMMGISELERWSSPVTLLMMLYQTYESGSDEVVWSEDEPVPYRTQVSGAHLAAATDIVVDDATPFVAGMRVRFVGAGYSEVALVTAVNDGTNTLTVIRDYGATEGWTSQNHALADNDYVQRLDAIYMQGHPLPEFVSTTPRERKNYVPEERTALGLTKRAQKIRKRFTADELARIELKAFKDHQVKLETANLDGKPYKGSEAAYSSSSGNVAPMASGGVDHYLTEAGNTDLLVDESELTQTELHDYYEKGFQDGSDSKIHVVPKSFRTGLDRWGISKQQTFAEGTVIGMAVDTYKSSHGKITYLTHDYMKSPAQGTIYNRTFLLDLDFLWYVILAGEPTGATHLSELDPYKATGETLIEKEWVTEQCVVVKQPGKVHGRLQYHTMAAA
jgi:hypothetical protein